MVSAYNLCGQTYCSSYFSSQHHFSLFRSPGGIVLQSIKTGEPNLMNLSSKKFFWGGGQVRLGQGQAWLGLDLRLLLMLGASGHPLVMGVRPPRQTYPKQEGHNAAQNLLYKLMVVTFPPPAIPQFQPPKQLGREPILRAKETVFQYQRKVLKMSTCISGRVRHHECQKNYYYFFFPSLIYANYYKKTYTYFPHSDKKKHFANKLLSF